MNLFFVRFLALVGVSALSAPLHAELKWERTRQQVTAMPRDFGVQTEFAYRNTGKQAVKIVSAKGGCSCCTKVKHTRETVGPGESGLIKVRVSLHKKTLPFLRPIAVTTDDGKIQVLLVDIVASTAKK